MEDIKNLCVVAIEWMDKALDKISNMGIDGERIGMASRQLGSPSMVSLDMPCVLSNVLYGNKDAFQEIPS